MISALLRATRDEYGAALVEFTVVAPVMLALVCGLSEFGMALRQYHVMEKGVRDADRYLSRSYGNPCSTDSNQVSAWTGDVATAQNLVIYGSQSAAGTALVRGATVTVGSLDCAQTFPKVKVTVQAPYTSMGMLGFLGLSAPTLTLSHQELKVS